MSKFTPLYYTLVRAPLEYAIQACLPNLVADADCLERIQQLATRLVKGFRRLPYKERLRRLGLHSLNRHPIRGDLIAAYKVFSGGLDRYLVLLNTSQSSHSTVIALSVNSFKRQLDSTWEGLFCEVLAC